MAYYNNNYTGSNQNVVFTQPGQPYIQNVPAPPGMRNHLKNNKISIYLHYNKYFIAQQWMQKPAPIPGCPVGLEYLTQIDQLQIQQKPSLLEGKLKYRIKI